MSDFILIDGDIVYFYPIFGLAIVMAQRGRLAGSGKGSVGGRALCIDGDEKKVSVPNCLYTAGPYSIPGSGALKIYALARNQKASKTKSKGKPVLLKGVLFTAKFEVQSPAHSLPPGGAPIPDPYPFYIGKGFFRTTNTKLRGA